jgi:microcystin-dependent protein
MSAATIGNAGGNLPVSIVQPYLAINFIIALQGIYPSRN